MSEKKVQRIQWLDVLRGIAILLVVAFHFTTRYQDKYPSNAFADTVLFQVWFGWIGVHLFFMISGFIIYLTIQKKKGPADFLVARLSRLMPPYWTAIVLILLIEYLHAYVFTVPNRNDFVTTVFNFIMVPDIFKMRYLDNAFWSLFVEIKFYLAFAVLWQAVNMKTRAAFYGSYAFILAAATVHNFVHHLPLGDNFHYFLIFWTGIAACKVLRENMTLPEYSLVTFLTTASTLGFYTDGLELLVGLPVFALLFVVSEAFFVEYAFAARLFSPLALIGRVSYSFYLLHQPVGYILLGTFAAMAFNHNLAVVSAATVCFFVALLGFGLVERLDKPIAAYIMNRINCRKANIATYP